MKAMSTSNTFNNKLFKRIKRRDANKNAKNQKQWKQLLSHKRPK